MNVGLIGCGNIANGHVAVYNSIEDAEVVAVSDIDLEKAKRFAKEHGIQKSFERYTDLLEIGTLDLVDICTPVSTHAHIACDAAEFGHNVLVEKPMAVNTSQCERMINESEKRGAQLCVCHNRLFLPSVMQAKSVVEAGDVKISSFKTILKESYELLRHYDLAPSWNITPREKGILWEVGCHEAYLQLHFLGDVEEVYAVGNRVKYPVYDDFTVLLRTSSRRYGLMEVSWVSKEQEILYEISTSDERRFQIDEEFDYLIEKSNNPSWSFKDAIRNAYLDQKRVLGKWVRFGLNYLRKRKGISHFNLIRDYVESLEKGQPPPVSPQDGKKTVKLLECIEKSLDNNQIVKVS